MNERDRAMTWPAGIEDDLPEYQWALPGLAGEDEPLRSNPAGPLVSLAFFWEALGRTRRVWCTVAVLGLLVGCALYVKYPPAYHAQASVLLVDDRNQNPQVEVETDQAVAQSQPVAASVVQKLGLDQSVTSFQATSTVTVVTPQVLTFDVSAPTSAEAVQRVAAVASSFLQYRAKYEQTQEQQQIAQLSQQYDAAQQSLRQIDAEISQLPTTELTPGQQTQLTKLQNAASAQTQIMQNATASEASTQIATQQMVSGSEVLNPATALKQSKAKGAVLYVVGGLFGGLVVGMAIVILTALLSDKLRRRDDVAVALGAPVRLSVGSLRVPSRLSPARLGQTTKQDRDRKRVIAYLRGAVSGSPHGPASLAVVAVDDEQTVASAVAALARSRAKEGKRVVVADLSAGLRLARLLGGTAPGVHPVTQDGTQLLVVVPPQDDVAPVGPVPTGVIPAMWAQPDQAVVNAYSSADLLLTLVVLDPATGADHLATWAAEAIVMVTAGRSSAEKVHSVGELIRTADIRFDSAILTGAGRSDASLGTLDRAHSSGDRGSANPERVR